MQALVVLAMVFAASTGHASDYFKDEIVCNKVTAPGEADTGLTLILQSNATAWVKNVAVYQNGFAGPLNIANVQVPLKPEVRYGNGFIPEDILTYKGEGLVLEIRVMQLENRPLNGGTAELLLPDSEKEIVTLTCEYANSLYLGDQK